ncbi:MAG: NADH:flavin oxidoreductase/NADH oxidase family protein [Rothia sp. (in: high G+C Gram-positive bacteria)]|nr:NADH:flavin oxidoreductase/NADH oxidase family protein [Rothia sp. (in: high G+C Gram-positive bacteria)]
MTDSPLFTGISFSCGQQAKNRIVKAAMSEAMAKADHNPSPEHIRLYARWAAGGAGTLISGNVMVDRRYLGEPGNLVLDAKSDLRAFRAWATAATGQGTLALVQLNHPGKQMPKGSGYQPIAPSAQPLEGELATGFAPPRAMTLAEIEETIQAFVLAAQLAQQAGFSGVEIHAAHGYLINQFLSPADNQRTDAYGGSFENRTRFLMEVYTGIRQAVGKDFIVGLKLNATDFSEAGFSFEDSQRVLALMEKAGADFIEISGGNYSSPVFGGEGTELLTYAKALAQQTSLPLISTGGFRSVEAMEEALAEGVSMIGLARPLVLNPELPTEIRRGQVRTWQTPRVGTGSARLDRAFQFLLSISYYEGQMRRLGRGKEPTSSTQALPYLLATLVHHGRSALRPRRA